MATAVKKLKEVQEGAAQSAFSNKQIPTVKMGRESFSGSPHLWLLVWRGAKIKRQMDELKLQLAEANEAILEEITSFFNGAGTLHVLVEDIDCTVSLRDAVTIEDAETLRELLGERFADLVKEKASYSPEPKLISMATDADSPQARQIAACLRIQEAKPTISYKGI